MTDNNCLSHNFLPFMFLNFQLNNFELGTAQPQLVFFEFWFYEDKMGLLTLRIVLCASIDSFSTISSINQLFKIYRGTLIITEDIIDDGDDRRHSWVVLCFNKIGQTNIYPQYEHWIKPVKGAIKIIEHERWANQSFLNLRGRIKPLFGQIWTRIWPHFGRNLVRIRSIRVKDPVSKYKVLQEFEGYHVYMECIG